ncbi:MAG TPA: hypothetical protein VFK47_18890, partial [Ktedonobacteraceae bacterium]|nr:hypothetical protein [Ktedonobacteraceae bacterium]
FVYFRQPFLLAEASQAEEVVKKVGGTFKITSMILAQKQFAIMNEDNNILFTFYKDSVMVIIWLDNAADNSQLVGEAESALTTILNSGLFGERFYGIAKGIESFYIIDAPDDDPHAEKSFRALAQKVSALADFEKFSVAIREPYESDDGELEKKYDIIVNSHDDYGMKLTITYRNRSYKTQEITYSAKQILEQISGLNLFAKVDHEKKQLDRHLAQ